MPVSVRTNILVGPARTSLEANASAATGVIQAPSLQTPIAKTVLTGPGSATASVVQPGATGASTNFGLWSWDAANATLDPNSATIMASFLTNGINSTNMTLNKYGVATQSTLSGSDPVYSIPRIDQGGSISVRIPLGTKPDGFRPNDFDGHLSVRNYVDNVQYDFWQAEKGMQSTANQAVPGGTPGTLTVNRTENLASSGFIRATTPVSSSSQAINFDSGVMAYTGKTATTVTGVTGTGVGTIPINAEIFQCDATGKYNGKIIQCAAGVAFAIGAVNEQTAGWGGNAANTRLDAGLITPEDYANYVANGTVPYKTLQWGCPHIGGTTTTYRWPALHNAPTNLKTSPSEGTWMRLNPSYDISSYGGSNLGKLVLEIFKKCGGILRDNAGATVIYALNPINGGLTWGDVGLSNVNNAQSLVTPTFPWSSMQILVPPGP